MDLSSLQKIGLIRKSKRIGRGESSGKGKTSGRGHKGQKARGKVRIGFEGGQLPIIKRLPFKRGIGNNLAKETLTLTLDQLNIFKPGEKVNKKTLLEKNLLNKSSFPYRVKIVAKGTTNKPLIIEIEATEKAKKEIEKAKGKVIGEGEMEKVKDA